MSIKKCETMKRMGVSGKIMCILMLLLHKSSQQQVFNDENTLHLPENYDIGWMKMLDDNMFISHITIPGTHDSLALHGGPAAECQAWSLQHQLNAGIRYFDLRVSGDDLKVVHGPFSQRTTFFDAFNTIKNFLSIHQTETVLVRLKHSSTFPDRVISQLKSDSNSWVENEIPRIQNVRGKVVFVQKNSFSLGVSLNETDKHGDYKVGNVEKKKDKIIAHLNEAIEACRSGYVVLNYSSGTGFPFLRVDNSPKHLAKEINLWLYNNLKGAYEEKKEFCFGVIAMDFPGFDLIQMVINFNKQVGI
ncbi:1-phosphatidylinositol phosphodiesterase-like [Carassius gibelio]|uniref:1-phosphatidylinositol phosphodiesterase-like n=1 Tax=Carassius gibelio TaxID=101364 RepID=UPI0022795935|nr:1-phosphatidylinositol phosphodiesterase-like [Carassius gibelio]